MIIDGNPIEKKAMEAFHDGDRKKGVDLQNQFVSDFRKEFKSKDHCSCTKSCPYHGKCMECVAIHRAHQDHLPNCFRNMVNDKIAQISKLTEDTVFTYKQNP